MKVAITILVGLLLGVVVAAGILAAFVFVGPDPVGPRPSAAPTLLPSVPASASPSIAAGSPSPAPSASGAGSPEPSGSPAASVDPGAAFHIGQPVPALAVAQVGGGTIDLATLRGKPVWLNFMQTSCPECVDDFPLMNGFATRYASTGLVVIAIDIREDESVVASFADRLKAQFPVGLDPDGKVQQTWGTYALPIHFWIGRDGIVRAGALGGVGPDVFAESLQKILPGVKVTP